MQIRSPKSVLLCGASSLALLLSSPRVQADTNAVFFCVSGASSSAGTTQTYTGPGNGWSYSAVAQVSGTTWNFYGYPAQVSTATNGTYNLYAPSNSTVYNPSGTATTIVLNAKVTVPVAVSGRNEPNNSTWNSSASSPLTAGWRMYNNYDYCTFTLTNLQSNTAYLVFDYANYESSGNHGGSCLVLASSNVPSGGASWLDVQGNSNAALFTTNGSGANIPTTGAAAGVTNTSNPASWGVIQAQTTTSGTLSFSCGRPGYSQSGFVTFPSAANSTVSGSGGSWFNGFQIIPYPIPVISVQPSSAPSVTAGSTAVISVTATNWYTNSNITYQWQLNGTNLANGSTGTGSTISGATSATLNISNAGTSDGGTYTVIVANPGGSVTSSNSVLTISSSTIAPSIVTQPANTNVSAGSTAMLSVSASGTTPLAYQWQWSTDGTNYSNVGTNGAILSITNAQISNSGYYNVTITNSAGSVTSSNATLTVTENSITNQPTGGLFTNGATTTLSVSVAANPAPSYLWQLSIDGYHYTNVPGGTSSNLPLTLSSTNSGFYRVIASNSVGATTSSVVYTGIPSTSLGTPTLSPANSATAVNRDTPFQLTFSGVPVVGSAGSIRIYNASNNALVASYNLGSMTIAPGIYQSGTNQYGIFHYISKSINGNVISYTPVISLGTQPGPTNFPNVPAGYNSNTAIISLPTSTTLSYGTSYYVQMDPGVFVDTNGAAYPGITNTSTWAFTVKGSGPATPTNIVVGNDGTTTDFSTVEGAAEYVSTSNTNPTTVTLHQGFYPEVVYWKSPNVTIQGQSRTNTVIAFINNNYINASTATRPIVDVVTTNVTLQDLAIYNMTPFNGSQAETIYTYGSYLSLKRVGLYSFQDTLLANAGSLFVSDSYIEGNVDFMWVTAATYLQRCDLRENINDAGAVAGYSQARNASNTYGFSYVNCTLDAYPGVTNNSSSLSRSFANEYPFNQTAYINCRMGPHITPSAWQLYDGNGITSQLWEYQSRDLSNNLLPSSVLTNRPTYNRSFSVSGTNIVYTAGQTNSSDVLPNQQISAALAAIMTNATQILGWTPSAPPDAVITLNKPSTIYWYQGESYVDPGATVVDPVDGTNAITGSGSVNTSVPGTNTVTYGYTNSLNIPAATVTRTVIVVAAPTITLTGSNPLTVAYGSVFSDPGATLSDPEDGAVTIYGSGSVNTSVLGSNTLTYGYTNSLGNIASPVQRTVIVSQAPATLQFGATNLPYNGFARTVSVTTTPASLAYSLTYAGSSNAPVSIGSYALVATITDSNHVGSNTAILTVYDPTGLWRQSIYGNTNNSGSAADTAQTACGYNNLQAYTFGLNPTTPSTNTLLNLSRSNSTVTLSFNALSAGSGAGYSGLTRYYNLEGTTNLVTPSWAPLPGYSNIVGANQTVNFSTNATQGTNWFFRLKAWLQ